MLTNAGIDKAAVERRLAEDKASHEFDAAEKQAHDAAVLNSRGSTWAAPEVVTPDSQALIGGEFSQSMSAFDHEKRRLDQIREARAYGNLRPAQIVEHADGSTPTNVFRDELETGAVVKGEFCWKCTDAVSTTPAEQQRRHAKLKQHMPAYQIPPGLTEMDCCGTCGAILKVKVA